MYGGLLGDDLCGRCQCGVGLLVVDVVKPHGLNLWGLPKAGSAGEVLLLLEE